MRVCLRTCWKELHYLIDHWNMTKSNLWCMKNRKNKLRIYTNYTYRKCISQWEIQRICPIGVHYLKCVRMYGEDCICICKWFSGQTSQNIFWCVFLNPFLPDVHDSLQPTPLWNHFVGVRHHFVLLILIMICLTFTVAH